VPMVVVIVKVGLLGPDLHAHQVTSPEPPLPRHRS
jgi:hypothetical protein